MHAWFPARDSVHGFHDTALFSATSPPGHWAFARLRFITTLEVTRRLPGRRVLDVAAGACFLAAGLSSAGKDVTLNDLRPLDEAMRAWRFSPDTRVLNLSVFDLRPEEIGRFDIVLCTELIEHVAHPDDLLRRLRALLNPEGHLVLTTPNGSFLGNRLPTFAQINSFSDLEQRQFKPDSDGHLFLMTPGELRGLLLKTGLDPTRELVFGAPSVSGYLKFRHLSRLKLARLWYLGEEALGWLPEPLRNRVASHMLVVARPTLA
jgi:2-polyprenyl-6-hydroxyphenyl methylase/3-demethylubiquinone-9 3-methyltransferase